MTNSIVCKPTRIILLVSLTAFTYPEAVHARVPFLAGEPIPLPDHLQPEVGSQYAPSISSDGLTLFYTASSRSSGLGNTDIWMSERESLTAPWGDPGNLREAVNTDAYEVYPSISADGLTLYFSRSQVGPGRTGDHDTDLWMATRGSPTSAWSSATRLDDVVNDPSRFDASPFISADALALYFASTRSCGSGGADIWVSTRQSFSSPWGEPEKVGREVNSGALEGTSFVTSDGRYLLFTSDRAGTLGNGDLWVATRGSADSSWDEPINLGEPINTLGLAFGPSYHEGSATLFYNAGESAYSLWQVPLTFVPGDLDIDGKLGVGDIDRLSQAV